MNTTLRAQAETIVTASIHAVLPDEAVRRALQGFAPAGRVFLAAAGKAAWQMAHAAVEVLGRPDGGVVITKYGHVKGEILGVTCYEAAHPVPDEAGFAATEKALALVHGLTAQDAVLFLLSGGGWVNSNQMGADFLGLPRASVLGLPVLSWCAIAALLLVGYFLRYSRTGRALYTAGGNATAAYYTGINAGKMQFVSFCLSGALAGFCGYLWISRFAVAYVDVANGFELQVVAACVIGGISTMGGSGRVLGCLCGALFLGVINNALPVIGISPFWQMAISGAVIVMAVLLNERGNRGHGRLILRNAALARQKQAVKS